MCLVLGFSRLAGPTGIEPATYGLRVRRSSLTELRALAFSLGTEHALRHIELSDLFWASR
jgi:hypothetical protein